MIEKTDMLRVKLPDTPTQGENLQTLLDAHCSWTEMMACRNINCNMQVVKRNSLELVDPKNAIVIYLGRERDNPAWREPWFRQLSAADQAQYVGEMNYRKVKIPNEIKVPDGLTTINYRLSATVEHSGGHAGGGHFVGFLLIDGEWFVSNDDKALRHSSYHPEYDHEKSLIFIYYRVDDLPSTPMFN